MVFSKGTKINNYTHSFSSKWLIWVWTRGAGGWGVLASLLVLGCFGTAFDAVFLEGSFDYCDLGLFSLRRASPDFCQQVPSVSVRPVCAAFSVTV